ncbi:MAG: hypothetical protein KKD90_04325 [Candidatus Omnitrophica bacterium]|nr:hypothetical protein [Candidatus Omnitrophota bacterium]
MRYFIFLMACCVFVSAACADEIWEPIPGISESDIREVAVKGDDICMSSENRLYRSEDDGETWNVVFLARGEYGTINFIQVFRGAVFICTDKGLFKSIDGKTSWKRIFKGIGTEASSTQHIAFDNNKIYLGTGGGLFLSSDNGATWQKEQGEAGNINIKWIASLEGNVFLATEKGVYKSSGPDWKRVFITSSEETEYDADVINEAATASKLVNSIYVKDKKIFLATDSGIFTSDDKGESWQNFTSAGLGSEKINRILFKDNLYAATDSGVFIFNDKDEIWQALYKGMDASRTSSIAADNKNRIWAATDKGLYRSTKGRLLAVQGAATTIMDGSVAAPSYLSRAKSRDGAEQEKDILRLFAHEPSIREVQEAAIEYAEVHPDKIKQWRSAAGKKALLPDVSVGVDRYVTDYWHWDAGQNPDVLQKGDDAISWDVTMSWDLGELIWNNDQTSIDTRSRLMVQLRDDILDEVTRTYFERRRLQIETLISPPSGLKERMERQLRIAELTADLDALTGGHFSNQPHLYSK